MADDRNPNRSMEDEQKGHTGDNIVGTVDPDDVNDRDELDDTDETDDESVKEEGE